MASGGEKSAPVQPRSVAQDRYLSGLSRRSQSLHAVLSTIECRVFPEDIVRLVVSYTTELQHLVLGHEIGTIDIRAIGLSGELASTHRPFVPRVQQLDDKKIPWHGHRKHSSHFYRRYTEAHRKRDEHLLPLVATLAPNWYWDKQKPIEHVFAVPRTELSGTVRGANPHGIGSLRGRLLALASPGLSAWSVPTAPSTSHDAPPPFVTGSIAALERVQSVCLLPLHQWIAVLTVTGGYYNTPSKAVIQIRDYAAAETGHTLPSGDPSDADLRSNRLGCDPAFALVAVITVELAAGLRTEPSLCRLQYPPSAAGPTVSAIELEQLVFMSSPLMVYHLKPIPVTDEMARIASVTGMAGSAVHHTSLRALCQPVKVHEIHTSLPKMCTGLRLAYLDALSTPTTATPTATRANETVSSAGSGATPTAQLIWIEPTHGNSARSKIICMPLPFSTVEDTKPATTADSYARCMRHESWQSQIAAGESAVSAMTVLSVDPPIVVYGTLLGHVYTVRFDRGSYASSRDEKKADAKTASSITGTPGSDGIQTVLGGVGAPKSSPSEPEFLYSHPQPKYRDIQRAGFNHPDRVTAIAVLPDDRIAIAWATRELRIMDLASRKWIVTLPHMKRITTCFGFLYD